MTSVLFGDLPERDVGRPRQLPPPPPRQAETTDLAFGPTPQILDVYEKAKDPSDPFELRDLYLGRVEVALGRDSRRPDLAEAWRAARSRRTVDAHEVLNSRSTIRFIKETFNHFFRDDLYGALRNSDHLILSSGAVDEQEWGLPEVLKDCIRFALDRDWYGYSDSRGREPAREAVAAYENAKVPHCRYGVGNVAITLGGTFAVSSVADFVLMNSAAISPTLCGIPNYPPLLESIARRAPVGLVETPLRGGMTSLEPLIDALRPDTPLVLLQTVTNPTGAPVAEDELDRLIRAASSSTTIVLDECHEWLGAPQTPSVARAASNVVRINSLSKNWSAPGMKIGWILADEAFVDEYYEFASTTFGGPQSFFYTAVEVLARLERWRTAGVHTIGPAELAEFETDYGLTVDSLQYAYRSYVGDRQAREKALTRLRDVATARLDLPRTTVAAARYSVNAALVLDDYQDSYVAFRDLLARTGVSVFPGLLTCCFTDGLVRLTTSRPWSELSEALDRLHAVLGGDADHGFEKGVALRS